MELNIRRAVADDVWPIMALYQIHGSTFTDDQLFLDSSKLMPAVVSNDSAWMIAEKNGALAAVMSVLLDRVQGTAKISRMMVNPGDPDALENLRYLLRHTMAMLFETENTIDVFYSTTLTLPLRMQNLTLACGFKIMGVFPNAIGADNTNLNGLTVYFREGIISEKRFSDFELHSAIYPFFKLAQKNLGLADVSIASDPSSNIIQKYEPLPPLELVRAPRLIENKYRKLKEHHQSLSINFYPFYIPNAIICDPEQKIEIYVKIVDMLRFSAIIGEHLELFCDPVALYKAVFGIFRQQGSSYIEIINDAADIFGTECIINAGFTPCAYIPAFKKHGDTRRDYVVYGKSFEYQCRPHQDIDPGYLEFFNEYIKLEKRNYFGNFPGA